jgi:hypothetical protein
VTNEIRIVFVIVSSIAFGSIDLMQLVGRLAGQIG